MLAMAQTTTCGEEFGKWVCRTQQPYSAPPVNFPDYSGSFAGGFAAGQAIAAARAQRQAAADAQHDADFAAMVRGNVARLVREGDCEAAKKTALAANDLNLAQQAVSLCTPKPQP